MAESLPEPEPYEQRLNAPPSLPHAGRLTKQLQCRVIERAGTRDQVGRLANEPELLHAVARSLASRKRRNLPATNEHRATIGLQDRRSHHQQRRLA